MINFENAPCPEWKEMANRHLRRKYFYLYRVYRYKEKQTGRIMYVGITDDLQNRIHDHSKEKRFKGHEWDIEFLYVLNKNDALDFEADFITLYQCGTNNGGLNCNKNHYQAIHNKYYSFEELLLSESQWKNAEIERELTDKIMSELMKKYFYPVHELMLSGVLGNGQIQKTII